jgi:hypothetical protein
MKPQAGLPSRGGRGRRYPLAHPSYILLLLPFIAMLWPSTYAKVNPTLWGWPFFYWYQFLWLIISAILTQLVFVMVRGGW